MFGSQMSAHRVAEPLFEFRYVRLIRGKSTRVHTYFMGCLEFYAIMPAVWAHNAAPLRDYISGVICLVGPT